MCTRLQTLNRQGCDNDNRKGKRKGRREKNSLGSLTEVRKTRRMGAILLRKGKVEEKEEEYRQTQSTRQHNLKNERKEEGKEKEKKGEREKVRENRESLVVRN